MTKNEYDPNGRVFITEVQSEPEAERIELPALNTATNSLVSRVARSGNDVFLSFTQAGQVATGVGGNGEVGIYVFEDALDASIIWHDTTGEQRIDLTNDDVKRHFGSVAGIFENPLLALKIIKPEIEL